jgi:hypothetical protein
LENALKSKSTFKEFDEWIAITKDRAEVETADALHSQTL